MGEMPLFERHAWVVSFFAGVTVFWSFSQILYKKLLTRQGKGFNFIMAIQTTAV